MNLHHRKNISIQKIGPPSSLKAPNYIFYLCVVYIYTLSLGKKDCQPSVLSYKINCELSVLWRFIPQKLSKMLSKTASKKPYIYSGFSE